MWRATLTAGLLVLATAAAAADRVVLENVKWEWQNAYGVILYTIVADVKNVSAVPVEYVRVKVELRDKNGNLVAERSGYNVGAEVLDEPTGSGANAGRLRQVKPIGPGAIDHLRLSFDKTDIGKPFHSTSVAVVEVH